jgi:peptidoglycan/LPS O-acetylase OafA/YrhL
LPPLSLGVYLIHYFVLIGLRDAGIMDAHSIWWRTLGALGAYALCAAVTWGMKKVPGLRRIVP